MLKTVSSITNAIGALNYKGTWNASTNTPTITSSVGVKGDYYQVSVAGSTTINGISNWGVGDVIAFNGTTWQRIEGGADLNGVNLSVSGTTTLSALTASTALALNAGKDVVSVTNTGADNNVLSTSPSITTPRVITAINDTNGNELIGVTATTSAVNEFTVANAATGNAPTLSATGGDTNIGMALTPKGTGGVIFPAGAVGTPAITTSGDLNTGIFFPAADTIAFTEGGAEAMRIHSSGGVSIGNTVDPGASNLSVTGAVSLATLYGVSYSQTSTSGNTSIIDTGITFADGANQIYLCVFSGNTNAGGSTNYRANAVYLINVTTDFTFSAPSTRIVQINETKLSFGLGGVGVELTLDAKLWDGSSEADFFRITVSPIEMRLKISGYASTVGANQSVRLIKLI